MNRRLKFDHGLEHGEYGKLTKRIVFDLTDHEQAKLIIKLRQARLSQVGLFRHLVKGYIEGDERLVSYIEEAKKYQLSKFNQRKVDRIAAEGKETMHDFGWDKEEIENIFDLIAEEIGDLL